MADGAAAAPQLQEPDWLSEARDRAKELGAELELPTQKQKGWEFTDLSGLDLDGYTEAVADGRRARRTSTPTARSVMPLAEAAAEHPELRARAARARSSPPSDPFTARNEARWRDGVLVYVPAGTRARPSRSS